MTKYFAVFFFAFSLCGCASNMLKQFDQVKVGMEKHDVLMLMDSPQRTQRWQGKDRWTYIFYDDRSRFEKEIHFQEGIANYVGDVYKPAVSAEEQDAMNEKSNQDLFNIEQSRQTEIRSSFGDYESRSKAQDGIRYVPKFLPVE